MLCADKHPMKHLVAAVAGLVAVLWFIAVVGGPAVSADTPVVVLAAEDPVLLLPVSPDVERIANDLAAELEALAAAEVDPRIEAALRRFAADRDLLRRVAANPVEMFDSATAAATATPMYDIALERESVVLVVATVELVPGYGSTAISRDHEDGHALINRKVAQRCGQAALRSALDSGRRGELLINGMIAFLSEQSNAVHDEYHRKVGRAGYGQHIRLAQEALDESGVCAS